MIKLAHPLIEDEERGAVLEVLDSGQLAQGPRVEAFERAFADYVGVRRAIAVNSGTAALHLALVASGIGTAGATDGTSQTHASDAPDEVIVPAFSFAATANVVLHAGARPVFVDVREDDFNIDPVEAASAITASTRAIMPVHLYGQMCDIEAIRALCAGRSTTSHERQATHAARQISLIEDAAQAVGASSGENRAGASGIGCFSFYATKNLQTGEGGMITCSDDTFADRARALRSQGESVRYVTEMLGHNYRMTEMAAALGLAQLAKLDARNERRRSNAGRLTEMLSGNGSIVTPRELPGRRHAWHQYTIRVLAGRGARDSLQGALRDRGIESAVFYPTPIHRQPLYQRLGYGSAKLPVAERLAGEVLSLPVHPALSGADLEAIASAVDDWTRAGRL